MFILSAQSKTKSEDYYATCSQLGTSLMAKIHHAALKREESQCITRLAPINPRGLEHQEAAWVRERCRGKRYYLLHERQRMDPVASSAKKAIASRFYQLRMGKAHTGPYLAKIGEAADDKCWPSRRLFSFCDCSRSWMVWISYSA
jgi:hypothetical protein